MSGRQQSAKTRVARVVLLTLAAFAIAEFYARVLRVNPTTVALSFLMLILFSAFESGLSYSIYLSVLCTLLYNFFFLPPVGSLTIEDPQNLVALLIFLASGALVSHISAKQRKQAEALTNHQLEVERLYDYSQRLLLEDKVSHLREVVPRLLSECLGVRAVALYLPHQDAASMWDPDGLLKGMESLYSATKAEEISARYSSGVRIVPVTLGVRVVGALAMSEAGFADSFYDAVANLTAIAMERAAALERTSHSEAAQEGERLRATLLDSMTHDLRTPLTAIRIAATTMVTEERLPEDGRRELAHVISEESMRLDRLIEEAVVMAQLGAGEVHVQKRPQRIGVLIESVVEDMKPKLRGREVVVQATAAGPELMMDRDLMRRVWKHLLENALRYSPAGSPLRMTASLRGERLTMTMEDRGFGIPDQDRPYVFDRFFRGSSAAGKGDGTGMGLAIVKAILEAHGGQIGVENRVEGGSMFSFWIPAEVGEA